MNTLLPPDTCQSMSQLRTQIDAIDVALLKLLETRSHYIDRAIDLKKIENLPPRTTDRVAEVLEKVSTTASEIGLDPVLARTLWGELIEWSITRESRVLDA